jgi:hypothetical protein
LGVGIKARVTGLGEGLNSIDCTQTCLTSTERRFDRNAPFVTASHTTYNTQHPTRPRQHLLALVQHLDSNEKLIVGGPIGQHVGIGSYASGGSGLLFSNGFLRAGWRHLGPFAAAWFGVQGCRG